VIAERTAETTWQGTLAGGGGTVTTSSSGALDGQVVSWAARTEQPDGKTSPEELAAAAHSSCFSMALAAMLGERKTPPQQLLVSATVTLEDVDGVPTVVSSALQVTGRVAGIDGAGFQAAVEAAAKSCPISRLFAGAQITAAAILESA
jgi:osmotically inducible protein OsmC